MSITTKNPLHSSALRLNDIHRGVQVVCFDLNYGDYSPWIIVSEPYVALVDCYFPDSTKRALVVDVMTVDGKTVTHELASLGIIPNTDTLGEYWSCDTFTISAKKVHLLPEPVIDRHPELFDLWYEEGDETEL